MIIRLELVYKKARRRHMEYLETRTSANVRCSRHCVLVDIHLETTLHDKHRRRVMTALMSYMRM